jgi:hypothetical protein
MELDAKGDLGSNSIQQPAQELLRRLFGCLRESTSSKPLIPRQD